MTIVTIDGDAVVMTDADAEALPGLTVSSRAEIFGVSYREQMEAESREPWRASWAARFGASPERIRDYIARGSPSADRSALCVAGAPEIVGAVRAVVAALPEVVAEFIVDNVVFLAGRDTWRGHHIARVRLPKLEPQFIILSCGDHAVIAHEIGHAFTICPRGIASGTEEHEQHLASICAQALAAGLAEELTDEIIRAEQAADKLATEWGWPIDTSSGLRADSRRRNLLADIEQRARRATGARP